MNMMLLMASTIYTQYAPLNDRIFELRNGQFTVESVDVKYSIYNAEYGYTIDFIESYLISTSEKLHNWFNQKKYPIKDCRKEEALDIYSVPLNILNDRTRFHDFDGARNEDIIIWGLFDSIQNDNTKSAIVLTDNGIQNNINILNHEIAHYWYHRYCLDIFTDLTTEQFAQKMEKELE